MHRAPNTLRPPSARCPRVVLLGAVVALSPGCGGSDRGEGSVVVRDSGGIRIVESRPELVADSCRTDPLPTLDIGVAGAASEYQLYRVFDAATLSDGRIAVANGGSGEVRIYVGDGTFERAFGGTGDGPGEFRDLFQLWVLPGDTIVAGDYGPWRLSYFTAEGEFIRAVIPEPRVPDAPESTGILEDGTVVSARECCLPGESGWVDTWLQTVRHSSDGALIDTLRTDPNGRMGWLDEDIRLYGRPLFEATSRVAAAGGRVVVGRGIERDVEVLELGSPSAEGVSGGARMMDGVPDLLVRWSGGDRTVTGTDVEAYRRDLRDRFGQDPRQNRFIEAQIGPDRPVADRFPSHAAIRLGVDGSIWVHEYPRPGAGEQAGWLVFGADGGFECHALLPEGLDVYEFGPDYLLGEREDDLELEHVVRYALGRP